LSAKLSWGAYRGKIHVVVRWHNRVVSPCVIQEDKTRKESIEAARGTLKAVLLNGDNNCPTRTAR
jgi:hypothetical protein